MPSESNNSANELLELQEPILTAERLGLMRGQQTVFSRVDLELWPGQVCAVCSLDAQRRLALLMVLAARMAPSSGLLTIAGQRLPLAAANPLLEFVGSLIPAAAQRRRAALQRRIGLGQFAGLNELPAALTVAKAIAAELDACDEPCDEPDVQAWLEQWSLTACAQQELDSLDAANGVRLNLALAACRQPWLVVLEGIEANLEHKQSRQLLKWLKEQAAQHQLAIIFGCLETSLANQAHEKVILP